MLKTRENVENRGWRFSCARELFVLAAEAARDRERCKRQLDALTERAESLGGSGFERRVSSTPDPHRMESRVIDSADLGEVLERRMADDTALLDFACRVLYGDGEDAGLWALVGWRADAIAHHYLNGLTWERVGELLGYSASHCIHQAQVAFDTCDGWGIESVMRGMGRAED